MCGSVPSLRLTVVFLETEVVSVNRDAVTVNDPPIVGRPRCQSRMLPARHHRHLSPDNEKNFAPFNDAFFAHLQLHL